MYDLYVRFLSPVKDNRLYYIPAVLKHLTHTTDDYFPTGIFREAQISFTYSGREENEKNLSTNQGPVSGHDMVGYSIRGSRAI